MHSLFLLRDFQFEVIAVKHESSNAGNKIACSKETYEEIAILGL